MTETDFWLDAFGILSFLYGFFHAGVLLFVAHGRLKGVRPCEKEMIQKREDRIDDNWNTLFLNLLVFLIGLIVMATWAIQRTNTASVGVSGLVLVLEVAITIAICRSTGCAYHNIDALLRVRLPDVDGVGCKYCEKA